MSKLQVAACAAGISIALAFPIASDVAGNVANGAALVAAATESPATPPNFTGMWTRGLTATTPFRQPASGPGPVRSVNASGAVTRDNGAGYRQGDASAPILQPWAAEVVRAHAASEHSGVPVRSAKETCWPMGVPYILELNLRAEILQSGKQIVFLYEELMQQRTVRLDAAHPANLKPTWFGDSVAHWEGDTLAVDTIGLDPRTWIDGFGTPHTDKLHVVERYKLRDPSTLDVFFTVEDPGAFTTPWSAVVTYRKDRSTGEPYTEIVCAENDRDASTGDFYPIPTAERSDF